MSTTLTSGGASAVPAEQVAALRRAASEYVLRATGCLLDSSEESLAFVDHYLDRLRRGAAPQPEVLRLIAAAIGAYLGELCIARFGGQWIDLPALEPAPELTEVVAIVGPQAGWRIDLAAAPLRIDPLGMATMALAPPTAADDESDGMVLLSGFGHLREPLQLALERMAPVDEDYYFSLTGRFETLVYAVELLIELQQGSPASAAAPTLN